MVATSDTNRPDDWDDEGRIEQEADESAAGFSGGEVPEAAELELGGDDERLPWLEGDDEEDEVGGYNTGQLAMFLLIGLALLVIVVGGIWWATRHNADDALVADGSVIKAPAEPYKEKPENPGGKTFEGTGDSSFVVSEGQSRQAQLGESGKSPQPGFETLGKTVKVAGGDSGPSGKVVPVGPVEAATSGSSGVGVQVGAYSNRQQAEDGWRRLSEQYALLSGMSHRIVEGQAEFGKVYRLQAVPGDLAAAKVLCGKLKDAGLNCYVKQ